MLTASGLFYAGFYAYIFRVSSEGAPLTFPHEFLPHKLRVWWCGPRVNLTFVNAIRPVLCMLTGSIV